MLSSKWYSKEKTTLASRYHRAISRDVIYNNKRKRLRDIRGTLLSGRISNRIALAPKEILSSSYIAGTRPRETRAYEFLYVACTRSRVRECRTDMREVRKQRLGRWGNFNRLVITDATQQVLTRILLGKRTSLLKLCEHPSRESTPVTNDELHNLNLDFENFMMNRKR